LPALTRKSSAASSNHPVFAIPDEKSTYRPETGPDGALTWLAGDVAQRSPTNLPMLAPRRFDLSTAIGGRSRGLMGNLELYGRVVIPRVSGSVWRRDRAPVDAPLNEHTSQEATAT